MLVFFIHGVATRNAKYADRLKELIRQEFSQRNEPLPYFYSGFWGHALNDVEKMWNGIHQDLSGFSGSASSPNDVFRYQQFRKGLLSEFVGDAFTYLNVERGAKIRELIATQLQDLIDRHPKERDLHIVAHSLGTVILWDILFSSQWDHDDSAYKIRSLIQGLNGAKQGRVRLKSITTMGSPILLFNLMLNINPETVRLFAEQYEQSVVWTNVIHPSDIIAYPIKSSLGDSSSWNLSVSDYFIQTDANPLEKAVRKFTNSSVVQSLGQPLADALTAAPAIAGASDAHTGYWSCRETTHRILKNLLPLTGDSNSNDNIIPSVIRLLQEVPGITKHPIHIDHPRDEVLLELTLKNGCKLQLCKNRINVHHVHVFNRSKCQFGGFVGWVHTDGLKDAIDNIKMNFC